MSSPNTTENFIDLNLPLAGKPCRTWYIIYGDLEEMSKYNAPLVVLHGGPGGNHQYLKTYGRHLASSRAVSSPIPVILYDSIGCGNSTRFPERKNDDGTVFNIDLHVYELDALITSLGIQDNFNLLGHSYGGMVAALYAARKQPSGLRRMILQSSLASFATWDEAQMDLRHQLSKAHQDVITRCEAENTTDSLEYHEAISEFNRRHFCRMDPPPKDFIDASDTMDNDPTVLNIMYGNNKFQTLGTCRGMSIEEELHKINVPTLLINGRYDTAQNKVVKQLFNKLPKVKWVQFSESGHAAHVEAEADRVIQTVYEFLTE